jgi:regulatory protein
MPPDRPTRARRVLRERSSTPATADGSSAQKSPADPEAVARSIVLKQLALSARSRSQLAATLAASGAPEEVSRRVLDRFEQVGLVNDTAFARDWVSSRYEQRGMSRRALAHELHQRGVDDATVVDALSVIDEEAERLAAERLVSSRLGAVASLPLDKQRRRLVGVLARRGYSSEMAVNVVREALGGDEPYDG